MELRGHVDDPFGEAACDTSGYSPAVVQLFPVPLSKHAALGGESPLAQLVLPDQGGWPRAFCFDGLAPGTYALLAFVDTAGTGRLDFRAADMAQPQGWYTADGGWGGAQSALTLAPGATTPYASVQLRAPTRFPPGMRQCEGGWLAELRGQPVLHLKGDTFDRGWAHGFLAAHQILDFLEFYIIEDSVGSISRYETDVRAALRSGVLSGSAPAALLAECSAVVEGMHAAGIDEVRSLGRPVDVWDVLAINYMVHVNNLQAFLPEEPPAALPVAEATETAAAAGSDDRDEECSQYAAWGAATAAGDADGGTIIGWNMDGECDIRKVAVSHLMLFAVEPAAEAGSERPPARYVSVLWPGCVGTCSGFNEHGLWVMNNAGSRAPDLPAVAAAHPQSSMMWAVRQLLASHTDETGVSAAAMEGALLEGMGADPGSGDGVLQNGKILFVGQRLGDGSARPDGCAFAFEGDHLGGWVRTAAAEGDAQEGVLRWPEALLATNHNMERGAEYTDASGVPAAVFGRDIGYSSRWRYMYTAGAHGLDALVRTGTPIGVLEMKRLLQQVAQGPTEHSVILRPDTRPMMFEIANAKESALERSGLWDAPHGPWTEFSFDEAFIGGVGVGGAASTKL